MQSWPSMRPRPDISSLTAKPLRETPCVRAHCARHRPGARGPQARRAHPGHGHTREPDAVLARTVSPSCFHLSLKQEAAKAVEFIKRLTIKVASPENPVSSLSGGNQQKVVIGKALMTGPKVLLMDKPSRRYRYRCQGRDLPHYARAGSRKGIGIIFVTSDLEEVLALSDRIVVMADGHVTGEFPKGARAADVIAAATPAKNKEQAA